MSKNSNVKNLNGKAKPQQAEFIFVRFVDHPDLQIPLFLLFLSIYIATLMGNFGMIVLILMESRLQTPMYFFLRNLSQVDIGYSYVIAPKMLLTFVSQDRSISFMECTLQFYFFCIFVTNECYLLGVMAYDRFVAICNPLLYHTAMSKKLCLLLVLLSYVTGFVNSTTQTIFIFTLSFFGSNVINHFFCDVPPVLKLSCSDIHNTHFVHFTLSTIIVVSTILSVIVSYAYIVTTILKIRSAEGRSKAFSTCASHLMAVTMFYGTLIFMYLRPNSGYTMDEDKVISVFYTLVIPMLNPLIYSLRNKEVKEAMKRVISRMLFA